MFSWPLGGTGDNVIQTTRNWAVKCPIKNFARTKQMTAAVEKIDPFSFGSQAEVVLPCVIPTYFQLTK